MAIKPKKMNAKNNYQLTNLLNLLSDKKNNNSFLENLSKNDFLFIIKEIEAEREEINNLQNKKDKSSFKKLLDLYLLFSQGESLGEILLADITKRYILDILSDQVVYRTDKENIEDYYDKFVNLSLTPEVLLTLRGEDYVTDSKEINEDGLYMASKLFWASHDVIDDVNSNNAIVSYIPQIRAGVSYLNAYESNDKLQAGFLLLSTERVRTVHYRLLVEFSFNGGDFSKLKSAGKNYFSDVINENQLKKIVFTPFSDEHADYLDLKLLLRKVGRKKERFWLLNIK